jgi:hypothetical protein
LAGVKAPHALDPNRLQVNAGVAIGLLLVASVAVSFLQRLPADVARSHCSEKGVPVVNLVLLGYHGSGALWAKRETVEFQVKGTKPAQKVVVELRQPVYFLPWQVVDFREEVQQ